MPAPPRLALPLAVALGLASAPSAAAEPAAAPSLQQIQALRAERDWLGALALVERARAARPDDAELYRVRTLTLLDIGASYRAWTLYRARPELFDDAQARRLESARLARLIAWGGLYAESDEARAQETGLARQALDEYQGKRGAGERHADLRTRFDELVLLNRTERHAEAIAGYRALQAEGVEVPPYALARVAESLLAERHPDEAARLLERVSREYPEDWDARLLLAYAYSEGENFAAAEAHLEQLRAQEPPFLRAPGARLSHPNQRRYDVDSNLALLHLYGQDTAGAQAQLEAMAALGPNNAGLQAYVGEVYRARGWSERALERFRIASTLEPEHVGARLGQIGALLDLDRVDLARPLHDRLLATRPGNVQVRRMAEGWDSRVGWQWQFDAATGRSDGDASPFGSRDGEYRLAVQSPLLADRWRLTASTQDAWADYEDARVHDRRAGAGVSYAFDRLQAEAGVERALDDWASDDTGYYLTARWRLADAWSARAGWHALTPDASLQARRAGITADGLSVGVSWRPSDHALLDAGYRQLRYDDGNRRDAFTIDAERRFLTRPHLRVDGLAGLYASRGSDDDVPYFNPSRDASLRLGARLDHIAWRRYDRHLRQRVTVAAGPYRQEGYGSAWVPELRYEHEWKFGVGRVLQYGVSWSRPVYDGARERRLGFDLAFRWGE
ncbi:poly-beta-1,6 N-acetyl-D-glucosamine export porin PgaA [Vulcaniibacterium tengchongense]|uniref:Biofilm PGA synthesis protein PgaA n=1 Tax=Vulcaniibacterium tengchongense TaxID=1273429 RepID=A0A3N4VG26_9GAMM|nr:poly-beta-1,6 N-acetyl-D-glucosamine export porin PgaA [Vulcaniibacterium tengchongense]RPE82016.1 biofilm PGA synthesis protein PgaA [Vulcaniibacterium tengchongense]